MAFIDQLERLAALRDKGAITDAEYERAKARVLDPQAAPVPPEPGLPVRSRSPLLRRSLTDRWLGGVCGGIGRITQSETWIWRLLFTAGLVFGGITAVIYVLLWIFVPADDTAPMDIP
jgi:phage shock protein PspC (stress-responsive transcriptional regulator)